MATETLIYIGGFILLFGAIWAIGSHMAKKRREAFELLARERGWQFHPIAPPGGSVWPRSPLGSEAQSRFPLFNQGRGRTARNFFFVEEPGWLCHIFDYEYTSGSGKSSTTHHFTVFMMHRQGWALPTFDISPQSLLHDIGKWFGFQDIDFPEHPEFSKRYLLRGADAPSVQALFRSPEMVRFFEGRAKDPFSAQGAGDGVIFWRSKRSRLEPGELLLGYEEARTFAACLLSAGV